MATPEIHILAPRDSTGEKCRRKDEDAPREAKPSKRQRVRVRRGKQENQADRMEAQTVAGKRDLLSTNTQSFRHLFSFGGYRRCGIGGESFMSCDDKTDGNGINDKQSEPPDVKSAFRFSIFDDEVVAENAAEDPSASVSLDPTNGPCVQVDNVSFAEAQKQEVVVHDGLAYHSPEDVRAVALKFNGSGCSLAKLQTEWLDGGKKDEVREDLRLKRYKRMKGRASTSCTGWPATRNLGTTKQR